MIAKLRLAVGAVLVLGASQCGTSGGPSACGDTSSDPGNCGHCGLVCTSADFCAQGQCFVPTLQNVCQQPVVRVLLDGEAADDAAGRSIAAALATRCGLSTGVVESGLQAAGVLGANGEPLRRGELLVAGGGAFKQTDIAWLEAQGRAPVVGPTSSVIFQFTRPGGGVLAEAAPATINPGHDLFVVYLTRAPSGATVLNAGGIFGPGTTAAAWYLVNRQLPQRSTLTQSWYVVDWKDTSGDGQPGEGDTWAVLAAGT